MVEAALIVPISMMFHELATNSLKYVALSASEGRVYLTWSMDAATATQASVRCEWREENGPPISPPQHKGFGTALIKRMASHLGGDAELNYIPGGLVALLTFSGDPR